jgi:hypothetical protein
MPFEPPRSRELWAKADILLKLLIFDIAAGIIGHRGRRFPELGG